MKNNIIKATDPPKLQRDEIRPLTEEQAAKLLQVAKEGEYIYWGLKQRQKASDDTKYLLACAQMAVLLALNTGMRIGEVFGLKWEDIDFEKESLNVQRSLVASSKGMIFEDPKTKGSRRKIAIPGKIIKTLEIYRKQQAWFATLLGDKFVNQDGLVFANSFGNPIDTTNFSTRYFKRMVGQAGLGNEFTFHDLRHTHATLLLKSGVNIKVISERLGHSTVNMTLDTYSHLMPDMQETAVKALEMLNMG